MLILSLIATAFAVPRMPEGTGCTGPAWTPDCARSETSTIPAPKAAPGSTADKPRTSYTYADGSVRVGAEGGGNFVVPGGEGLILTRLFWSGGRVLVTKDDSDVVYHVRIYDLMGFGWYDQTIVLDEDAEDVQVELSGDFFQISFWQMNRQTGDREFVIYGYRIGTSNGSDPEPTITTIIDPDN